MQAPPATRASSLPFFAALTALVLGLGVPTHLNAQGAGGTISGTVSDSSGAVIPNVQISIKDVATGVARAVASDASGLYTAPNLLPGTYEITATAPGFATEVRTGITLTVGAQLELNLTMQVGQATQKVEVTGEAPAVQLATSSINATVNSTTVRELPLNGRDWTSLAALQPGVASIVSLQPNDTSGFEKGNRGWGAQMTISGARPGQNSYRVDGIYVNDIFNGSPGSVFGAALGVDAIQEFSVLTSNYSAEYGRTSGGVVNAITRSGTNQIHGDAYEFLRNSSLDAANFFDNFSDITKPPFRRNQFGASAGGPIRKDRTFFFGDYEGLRQSKGITNVDTIPSLDARNGIIHNSDGTTTTVAVDPLVKPFLGLFPIPNGAVLSPGNAAIFSFPGAQVISENYETGRVDHKISDKDSLFGTYESDKSVLTLPDSYDSSIIGDNSDRQFVALEETHIFNPRLLNSFRVGFNRYATLVAYSVKAINPLAGDPSLSAIPGFKGPPEISIPGMTLYPGGLGAETHNTFIINAFQGFDDIFFTKGIQSLKFGFAVERDDLNTFTLSTPGGEFKFGSLTDFLINQPKSLTAGFPQGLSPRGGRQSIFGGYAQDDVHWRPNLVVNLGLRYEMATNPTEVQGKIVSIHNIFTSTTATFGNPLFTENPTMRNFEPRVGFAWDPFRDGKTSVRGGFGVFDVLPLSQVWGNLGGPPWSLQGTANSLAPGSFPAGAFGELSAGGLLRTPSIQPNPKRNYVMQWNLSLQHELAPNLTATAAYIGTRSVHQPFRMDDANAVIPTQTPEGILYPFPAGSGTVLNTNFGRIDYTDWSSDSFYDGLELQIAKRMSHGLQVQGAYTWGKVIDTSSGTDHSDPYANSITSLYLFNPKVRRGLADFNIGQNLVINYTWNIAPPPSLHGFAAWAVGGWQLGGILTMQSGLPFTPLIGGDPLGENSQDTFDYPNRLTGPGCQSLANPGNVNNYIKLNCFAVPTAPASLSAVCTPFPTLPGSCSNLMGNSGRNDVIGPGLANFDFSLFKNNYVRRTSESFNVQFRAEFFNSLNRANFASPVANSTLFDQTGAPVSGAGLINGTTTDSREIQFALKVLW